MNWCKIYQSCAFHSPLCLIKIITTLAVSLGTDDTLSVSFPTFTQYLHVPRDQAPNRILRMWDLPIHISKHSQVHVQPKVSNSNPNSSTLGPDRPQHDRASSCVFSRHYSLTTTFSQRSHSRKKKKKLPTFQKSPFFIYLLS